MNDKLSSEAQDFLSLATSEGDILPSDADRKRVRKGVAVALAATSAAGVAASAGSASAAASGAALATGGLGLKALMVVGLVTVAGAGALSLSGPDEADARPTSSPTRPAQTAETEPSSPNAPALPVAEPTMESVAVPIPSLRTPEAATATEALTPTPATVPNPNTRARRSPARVVPPVPQDEAPSAMSLSDELGLLRNAQRARVQGNFDEALRQLDEHSRRFPAGRLAAERDGTRVFVLCDADRSAEATSAQRAFLRDHATSPLVHRVRSGCD